MSRVLRDWLKRWRVCLIVIVLAIVALSVSYTALYFDRLRLDRKLYESAKKSQHAHDDADALGRLDHLTMMQSLPREVVPTADNGRRLIVIGDIHAMDQSLDRLLNHIEYDGATDHIVAAGDMVNKGPHSSRVIARLMELGASAVRGNHEDRVLLALAAAVEQEESRESEECDKEPKTKGDNSTSSCFQADGKKRDRKTAHQLSKEQIKWLAERPLILSAEDLAMYVVHAGLVPGIRPVDQDPWAVMNMRSLIEPPRRLTQQVPGQNGDFYEDHFDEDQDQDVAQERKADEDVAASIAFEDLIPIDTHEGRKWAALWDLRQSQIRKADRRTVVYGHDAKRGLTIGKYTYGLDSACVNGGHLTALVIHVSKKGHVKRSIRQIRCKKYKR
ncbi:hypothetical protein LLEC1_04664 [Akanthomyces lecanii]|uniref:Calcineurin-like phosphoesterase domain-containing protein n=1 Tax=Cordyceps confragosa TaxID=2714763 RepID=A0A179IL36_CORDF|nr:hypothetical protein LLEC1_04664 [Akanthomyces lecanii]